MQWPKVALSPRGWSKGRASHRGSCCCLGLPKPGMGMVTRQEGYGVSRTEKEMSPFQRARAHPVER